ncbi:MAG: hypothetical protein ACFFF4_10740, partial [Candidatus Thorarchaeota archaeon]
TDLYLDTDRNWIADEAEISLWNLERLYAVNGSFDEGIPGTNVNPSGSVDYYPNGWDANSTDTLTYDDDVQLAAYDSSGREYVTVENQGGKVGQNAFGHVTGTKIVWIQNVTNTPYTEDFTLNFDYFYLRGPLDGLTGTDPISGNCSIALFIDGVNIWNMSLLLLSQRGVWLGSGDIPITVSGVPSNFTLEIGLVIDETLTLDKRYDYDGDAENLPDGIDNAAYITVYLDDISFIKSTPPVPEVVDLKFSTDSVNSSFTGSSGMYYATIVNASFWDTSPVAVEVISNVSVSFEYEARLKSHRFTDSNWRTDVSSFGVAYSVEFGKSPELTFYAYVGYLGDYEDPEMIIRYPIDWENFTISDPFLLDITGSCTINSGNLSIPSSLLDRLGWWQFELQSPNYGEDIEIQIYDSSLGWTSQTQYRVGNLTRPRIEIGTESESLDTLSDVNITWSLPNNTVWYEESLSGGIAGVLNGSSKSIDSSLAGQWQIGYQWSNGTEVAYLNGYFDVYHASELIPLDSVIETDVGDVVTGRVEFRDAENGDYLIEDAQITGNWSTADIVFNSNPTRKWWEADLDTSIIGAGFFVVQVNATLPYFDNATCQFSILSTNTTRLTSPNSPWTSVSWEEIAVLTFHYERYDAVGTSWVPVTNSSADVVATVNWTMGAWSVIETGVSGIYEITIDTSVKPSANYLLNVSFSKPAHDSKQLVLALVVTPQASSLSIYNGSSTQVDIEDSVLLKLNYSDRDGHGIDGANLIVDSVSPSSGLIFSSINSVPGESGNYSVMITVSGLGVYTIRFLATKEDHISATSVFVLVVSDVPTSFSVTSGETAEIGLSETFTATYHFEMFNTTPIEGAQLTVLFSGPSGGITWNAPQDDSGGDYSIQFDASISGAYLITVAASKQYHQSDSISFFLSVGEITTYLDSLNGTAETIDFGTPYRLVLSYYNSTLDGLPGADVSIVSINPSTGLDTGTIVDEGSGLYSIMLDPKVVDIYTLVFQANLTNHQTQFASFTLNLNDIITDLNITTGNSAEIGITDTFEAKIHYESYNGTGIENADVNIVYSGPSGLTWSVPDDEGSGDYSMDFDPQSSGTYLITISASKQYYQTASSYFFLLVGDITTHLDILNGSAKTINFGETFRLILSYYNNTPYGLEGANVSVLSITPSTGLSTSSILDEGGGLYSLILDPQVDDTFTLLFRANLTNHQTQFTTFTLVSNPVPTELIVKNSTTSLQVISNFSLYLRYEGEYSTGITGANLMVLNPPVGLTLSDFEDIGNGYYILYIFPTLTGSYQLTITSSKQFYQTESTSVFLVVGERNSQLAILNGTAGNIVFGENYELWLSYTNSTDAGLEGANISIVSISPVGLSFGEALEIGEGIYSILLDPLVSKTFSILVRANLTNFEVQFALFTLVVEPVSTVLKAVNATRSISVDEDFELVLRFENDNSVGLEGAIIESLTIPIGITLSTFTELGLGYYEVLLSPTAIGVYNLLFRASLSNHQNASASYLIEASRIPTDLRFLDDISSGTCYYGDEFEIHVFYERTDTNQNVSQAIINATTGSSLLIFQYESLANGYTIIITPFTTGVHVITIQAARENHKTSISTFTLTIREIPTILTTENVPEEILFNHSHVLTLSYLLSASGQGVSNISIMILGSKAQWIDILETSTGVFNITITPDELETFSIAFQFLSTGFETQSETITFTVIKVIVGISLVSARIVSEGTILPISVDLFESSSGIPVQGASLQCRLDIAFEPTIILSEEAPGRYTGQLSVPLIETDSDIDVQFYLTKENYQLSSTQRISITVKTDILIKMGPVITTGGSLIGLVVVSAVGLRVSRTRKRKRNLKAIKIKQRFDDVKNIIGIIILHKSSGLPIYSRTLKGGFDESMVSAFITAVSHFRSEFGMDEKHWDFQVIPISDIISAIPTRNLICAFITASNASNEQMVKMEAFGRAVGAMFDEALARTPTEIQDDKTEQLFTTLFTDLMDGEFLAPYRKRASVSFPRNMKCMNYVVRNMDHPDFTLDELARGMAMCGIEEGEAYLQVMDAIELKLIEPVDNP